MCSAECHILVVEHRRQLHRSNQQPLPRYSPKNRDNLPWYLSGAYVDFWSESTIFALIALTKFTAVVIFSGPVVVFSRTDLLYHTVKCLMTGQFYL